MIVRALLLLIGVCCSTAALAQGTVLQSGPMIPNDLAKFIANGVIADSGISALTGLVTNVQFVGDGTVDSATPTPPCGGDCILTATLLPQAAGTVLAGPLSGPPALPTWKTLTSILPPCNDPSALAFTNCTQHYTKEQSGAQCFYPATGDPARPCTISFVGTTFTIDMAAAQHFVITLPNTCTPCTMAPPSNFQPGHVGMIDFTQPPAGGATISWDPIFRWSNAAPTPLTGTSGADDFFAFYGKDATHIVMGIGPLNAL